MRVWQEVPLGEVVERITGGKNIEAGSGTSAFRIMKVSAVTSGVFKPNEAKPAPDGHVPAPEHHVRESDFLFSRANTSELVGAVAIAHNPPDGLLLPDKVWRIEWNCNRIYPRYAYYMLRSAELRRVLGLISSGTSGSMKNISQRKLVRVLVPLPPLDEQQRIVELLDRAADIRRRADAARAKARAIIPALFLDTFGDPATNPKGWPETLLSKILATTLSYGSMTSPRALDDEWLDIRVANIKGNQIDHSDTKYVTLAPSLVAKHSLADGDIVLARAIGSESHLGKCAVVFPGKKRWAYDSHIMRIRVDQNKVSPVWLHALMNTDGGKARLLRQKRASAIQHNINTKEVAVFKFPLPSLPLQTAFAEQAQRLEFLARHLDAAAVKADAMAAGLSAEVFGSPASPARRNAA